MRNWRSMSSARAISATCSAAWLSRSGNLAGRLAGNSSWEMPQTPNHDEGADLLKAFPRSGKPGISLLHLCLTGQVNTST